MFLSSHQADPNRQHGGGHLSWRAWRAGRAGQVSENSVPLNPMVLLIIIPFLNGYFIGNIPYFQTNPHESTIMFRVFLCCQKWPGSPAKSQQPNSGYVRKLDHQTPFGMEMWSIFTTSNSHQQVADERNPNSLSLAVYCQQNQPEIQQRIWCWDDSPQQHLEWYQWYRWEATNLGRIWCGASEVSVEMVILPQTHLVTKAK